ncbi:MAG: carboxypeptidase regulatory-like domain-containing protein [Gemmatimonadaceae bacterium]
MWSFRRTLAAAGAVAVSITCADHSAGPGRATLARLPISPVFQVAALEGGPRISIATVQGILRRPGSADSSFARAEVRGDSAVLQFERILVTGDSTLYDLGVRAYDANEVMIFKGFQEVSVKPGDNAPAAPTLEYTAPDAHVVSLDAVLGTDPVAQLDLQWAGARPDDASCLSRIPSTTAVTQQQLSVIGRTDDETMIPEVRVGWSSRDSSVATVDADGVVRARCSNKSTYIVAQTYLGVADSVRVDVAAPPFTLLMSPEAVDVPRGDSAQLRANFVDENGNPVESATVTWHTSDSSRATVDALGWVRGIANGRVLITAASNARTTVGVVEVVPPLAASVQAALSVDTLAIGQSRLYRATAFDARGAVIPDADRFEWFSSDFGVASVNSSGLVTGRAAGNAMIVVKIDERKDTTMVHVREATDGAVTGVIVDAATGAPIPGASIGRSGGSTVVADQNGAFMVAALTPGVDLIMTASGFVPVTFYAVPVRLGETLYLGELPMVSSSGSSGTISALVVNALDDSPVAGATVSVFQDINAPSTNPNSGVTTPAAIAQRTTDALGNATFAGVPPGTYTYVVTATGFSFTRKVVVSIDGASLSTRIALAPVLGTTLGLRVVLSWGDCQGGASNLVPCDLDVHMTGPASAPDEGRFHVAYFNEFYLSGEDTVAVLDNDATTGLGPETVTLRPKSSGVYKFYVHNYTDVADSMSTRLSASARARVDVYKGTSLIATFYPPPATPGVLWAVFQIDGSSITPVNEMIRIQDFPVVPGTFLRMPDADSDEIRSIIRDWPGRRKQ